MRVQDRLALARAVARADHARLLDPDNVAGPGLSLREAAAGTQAYFVTPRSALLVVDCDLPSDGPGAADMYASLDLLLEAADRAGVAHWVVDSGRPGNRHAYLVTGTGPEKSKLERWCRSRGLDVRTHGIRPPGAPHRELAGVGHLDDGQIRHALAVLQAPVDADATGRLAADLCPMTLPGRVLVAVRHGHAHAGYDSPSHARMALAVAVRARGGSAGLVDAILRDASSPLGETYRGRTAEWQRAELSRIWDKAGLWIGQGGRARDVGLDAVAAAAANFGWKGTGGGSDLAVLEHLVKVGRRIRSCVVGEALADVGVGAGVSTDTARAAVRRLVAAGWLRIVSHETARTTRTYELRVPPDAAGTHADLVSVDDVNPFADLGADLARHRGLGKVTMRVARAAQAAAGASARELAQTLSMSVPAVRHHLRKLTARGVLVGTGATRALVSSVSIIAGLEIALGVHGARAAQQQDVARARWMRARIRLQFAHARRASLAPPAAGNQAA